jgi:hypothetical protein
MSKHLGSTVTFFNNYNLGEPVKNRLKQIVNHLRKTLNQFHLQSKNGFQGKVISFPVEI